MGSNNSFVNNFMNLTKRLNGFRYTHLSKRYGGDGRFPRPNNSQFYKSRVYAACQHCVLGKYYTLMGK